MNIYIQDYSEELYIEEYETEYGTRYRAYSGEIRNTLNFEREGYIGYCALINEWKELVDKLKKSEEIVIKEKLQ